MRHRKSTEEKSEKRHFCRCIRKSKEERSTVKQLLVDDFFTPEELIGIRVEIKNRDADLVELNSEVRKQLKL